MTGPGLESLDGDQLTDLITRLLLDGDMRDRLASEGAAAVAANAAELECLATVDLEELGTAARRFRSGIWRLGREGGLSFTFARSLRMLAEAGSEGSALLAAFIGSRQFGQFRLVPYAGPGLCVEECFASFLLSAAGSNAGRNAGPVLRETITHELMIALFAALATEQPLSFVIGTPAVIKTGRGHAALCSYSPAALDAWEANRTDAGGAAAAVPYAYFAVPGRVARGVVSSRVAAAFEAVPTAEGDAARLQLSRRGLW
jgi:hypothetical protein